MSNLTASRVVLGVTGGIAAYKAADLASRLVQHGAEVDVILTASARRFIQPLTFQAITHRDVHLDAFAGWRDSFHGHVSLAHDADAVVIAPATANTIARLALGLADDLLTLVTLSTGAPIVIAPAMEHGMWHNPAVQDHLRTLTDRNLMIVDPQPGRLASGAHGDGRLADSSAIVGALRHAMGRNGPLAGRKIVMTAGGTREPLDPVRFLGNRSSGIMGYALAQAALDRGADVTLISGPTTLLPPYGAAFVSVETAVQMQKAVEHSTAQADALVMAAAVADFQPVRFSPSKIKKTAGLETMQLDLTRTADILGSLDRPGLVKIGFAAETDDLVLNATAKLHAKGLSMIVANDAAQTIGNDRSAAVLLQPGMNVETLPLMSKEDLSEIIADRLAGILRAKPATGGHDD